MLKPGPVWAVGTMSGTSLDGVDAALVLTDGTRILDFGRADYRPYSEAERETLRAALGRWPGEPGVEAAAEVVETAHAELLSTLLEARLVGFHGQTLAHDPDGRQGPRRTHQAGSGTVLAEVLGRPVVWDFRSMDVELGGQGAPLVPFFHFACAKWAGLTAPVAILNLGGVGNVTWLDPRAPGPEVPGAVLAFDTGPANAPLNDLMRARGLGEVDEGGALARAGRADEGLLARFLAHPYFLRIPPKSLDRNDFNPLFAALEGLCDADAAATLTAFAAAAVARGFEHFPSPPSALYVAGGGRLNEALMVELAARVGVPVAPVEDLGLDGDMLEAQAFAYLAVRVARGLPTTAPTTTGVAAFVGGGQISQPD
ncbi:anhydro-N-acetylmuramic acid kinase [Rhodobacter xanthinilyticus]|uniref:Anhydro-N-acetylmuramic acid kinase n=1 Tax=Rhodobacter xanthinilyticus TaxID=1850250 RepID=A0A1D9MBQ6_9RHOB|nr:anhydro-N-acetylmuramic acid kinase [Rhodobacter xanthinilyticus]AOZ69284.1 anhydro-N-acetylmuramic acid kinase [Rhodobacter xanthinilyticus]